MRRIESCRLQDPSIVEIFSTNRDSYRDRSSLLDFESIIGLDRSRPCLRKSSIGSNRFFAAIFHRSPFQTLYWDALGNGSARYTRVASRSVEYCHVLRATRRPREEKYVGRNEYNRYLLGPFSRRKGKVWRETDGLLLIYFTRIVKEK